MRRAVLFAFMAVCIFAQPRASDWPPDRAKRVGDAAEAERVRQGVIGMTAAVATQGALRWVDAFGKADLENAAPVTKQTLFRTASIAKPMTAVAALRLWELGKLDLDAPVQKYVPSFPEKPWKITVRALLGHLSGIRSYIGDEQDSVRAYTNVVDPLRIFSGDALLHPPGTKYLYTTYGYNLAGAAVESAAGMPFLEYLRESVLRPAKMEFTRDDNAREIIPNRTRWYSKTPDGRIVNAVLADMSNKVPGGGMLTTAEDLIRFAGAWESEKLLKKTTMSMQTQRQKMSNGKLTGYGLGWNVSKIAGKNAISHSGGQHGCRSFLAMFPEQRITIAVLTNSDHADPLALTEAILRAVESGSDLIRITGATGTIARPNKRR